MILDTTRARISRHASHRDSATCQWRSPAVSLRRVGLRMVWPPRIFANVDISLTRCCESGDGVCATKVGTMCMQWMRSADGPAAGP